MFRHNVVIFEWFYKHDLIVGVFLLCTISQVVFVY